MYKSIAIEQMIAKFDLLLQILNMFLTNKGKSVITTQVVPIPFFPEFYVVFICMQIIGLITVPIFIIPIWSIFPSKNWSKSSKASQPQVPTMIKWFDEGISLFVMDGYQITLKLLSLINEFWIPSSELQYLDEY